MVRKGAAGIIGLCIARGKLQKHLGDILKKVKSCDLDWIIAVSHGSMPQGALDCTHRQPYRPNGGAIKDMGNNFDFRFQLHGKSPSSFTSCFLAAVLCFGRWLAKWRVHSKRSVAWLQSWKEVRDQEIPRDHRFPARNQNCWLVCPGQWQSGNLRKKLLWQIKTILECAA